MAISRPRRGIANVHLAKAADGRPAVALELSRSGARSTFGDVRILKPGAKEPIAVQKAVAVYTEIGSRRFTVPVRASYKGALTGPVTVQYLETSDKGAQVIAETQTVLR